jgi:hypothetical protein
MTETLHIITPVTRPENIRPILKSIGEGWKGIQINVEWWLVFDIPPDRSKVPNPALWENAPFVHAEVFYTADKGNGYGGPQRSRALDRIVDGWIGFIDDDSMLHPDLIRVIAPYLSKGPRVYLFGQVFKNGGVKYFEMDDPCRHFEHSMGVFHRSLVGDIRQPAGYDCDKQFVRPIYEKHKGSFVILPYVLAYYNWLRDDGWSWK